MIAAESLPETVYSRENQSTFGFSAAALIAPTVRPYQVTDTGPSATLTVSGAWFFRGSSLY